MKLHLFNPENDLALGIDCINYTPPPNAAALHRAGALFPLWWAGEGDAVITPKGYEEDKIWMRSRFGLSADTSIIPDAIPSPWGWSKDARRQFLMADKNLELLPSDQELADFRRLSSRASSIDILSRAGYQGVLPINATNVEDALSFISTYGRCYVKSPWSGSGRGVFSTAELPGGALRRRIEGIIHRQGSVIVEKELDKVMDFALLLYRTGNEISIAGLSVFLTEPRGMYCGNLVAPQHLLREIVCSKASEQELDYWTARITQAVYELMAGESYQGPIGIDMLVHSAGIMPCIEMNMRMTMGFAAMAVADRLGVTSPHVMAWNHGDMSKDSLLLLPPREGFALTLNKLLSDD
ncbi:MAG: hypothetical protein NC098_07355 [Lachnoclostridium sp.]|nr:hypothetical protein [Lachnoclostridium sp.]